MKQSNIINWRHEYNLGNEEESKDEKEILESVRTSKIKTWEDLKSLLFGKPGILSWKGALRTKNYYESLDSNKWNLFFKIIKCSNPSYWYYNHIGEIVKVIKYNDFYWIPNGIDINHYIVSKNDVIIFNRR